MEEIVNDIDTNVSKPKDKRTLLIILLAITLLIVSAFAVYAFTQIDTKEEDNGVQEGSQSELEAENLALKEDIEELEDSIDRLKLQIVEPYNIFGGAEFSSVVTGYIETRGVPGIDGEGYENAYLVITDFEEEELQQSIKEGIDRGNEVNRIEDGKYFFNLGCFVDELEAFSDEEIRGEERGIDSSPKEEYMDTETQKSILKSTEANPVKVTLYFGFHYGSECHCCNLAHKIRLVD